MSESEGEESEGEDDEERAIFANARCKFGNFRPRCITDCRVSKKRYVCPQRTDLDGLSDDEEWLKPTKDSKSPNKYFEVWWAKIKTWQVPAYYTWDQKTKLEWAVEKYFHPVTRNKCPFVTC